MALLAGHGLRVSLLPVVWQVYKGQDNSTNDYKNSNDNTSYLASTEPRGGGAICRGRDTHNNSGSVAQYSFLYLLTSTTVDLCTIEDTSCVAH